MLNKVKSMIEIMLTRKTNEIFIASYVEMSFLKNLPLAATISNAVNNIP